MSIDRYVNGLPRGVTATLEDEGLDGIVYRLKDSRGYTHQTDVIRVGDGRVDVWRREGWVKLLTLNADDTNADAQGRAVAVLYGMEDHG